ncbi:hypothetical protein MJO28_012327 [Puccinia striiformis f. sp. tritici]|uniref:Peptidase S8/S53 domain-containing protein n=3 Tax=Puccinia striiformis TaxID=27350 RepID=A0A0L0V8U7_9BASI|nr:hypothetical protein Pst134EA_022784 [Puccinia striiformis f. sp. tritici]KAI9605926.1 hypothetical protein H4Q26_004296 [Puccinia striiformis f. sp. tritici PST-130]KNE95710.1 hypothetical protein PSTG_10928 [Puccinia striiformis f. sp. tritici PST-78]POW04637.1 hypothetical protein PSTT_10239 [Puccinia striiformis]KAH9445816.1 hypothetical protein Pst134EB_023650 [Puccinia striiformis f. sp. tritici]KAH9455313.1 hypothetical protein Pst134EA_022784 [Puccinia striiformis f. sp. tritici]
MTIMFASKISVSMLLAVQLSFMLIPETSSLVPSNQRHYARNATLENPPNLPRNKTSTPTKNRSIQRPVSKHAPASDQHKSYIVLLNDQVIVLDFVSALQKSWKSGSGSSLSENRIGYVYKEMGFNGFSAQLDDQAFKSLSRSAGVQEIIPDSLVSVNPIDEVLSDALSTAGLGVEPAHNATVHEQGIPDHYSQKGTAPWGLQRLDQRQKITIRGANSGAVNYDYYYSQPAGEGVIVYILDTGARETHNDFGGRVEMAAQFGGYDMDDGNGHGTHCAGIVAGNRWGVAKRAQVKAIKVLADDGSGSTSDVIAGVQYALQQYRDAGYPPTVVSLSLGGEKNTALDRAVQAAISQGIHFVVAAGNSNTDACLASPAAVSGANVVSASDIKDNRASYASWGTCVDFFAPGTDITSAWFTADDATKRMSGTSMATPHVAGLIAAHLSRQNYTTQQMSDKLKRDATRDAIYLGPVDSDPSSTPNLLLYNSIQ